jgi:hypothetical protein
MQRRKYSNTVVVAAVVAALAFIVVAIKLAPSCGGMSQGHGNFYNMRKIDLRTMDKKFILQIARQALRGESVAKDEERYPLIFEKEPRGVFLTLARPNEAALTGFGFGDSIYNATTRAADVLRRLAKAEDVEKLRLRVDVMDESTDEHKHELGKKWGSSLDISLHGMMFDTSPAAAFMPEELRDWGIFDKKNGFHVAQIHKLIKQRKLGNALADQFKEKKIVHYASFTTVSFMESGKEEPLQLFRGNRVDGFDATPDRLLTAIRSAGEYLKKTMHEDGQFDYLYYPDRSKSSTSYNELRHAGTLYAMAQIYDLTKDPAMLAAIKRGLDYLQKISLGPDPADGANLDFRAVAEPAEKYSKLGGTGLALLAFGEYTQVTGDQQYLDLMRAYGRFVEYMQQPNGDMRMWYYRRPEDKNKTGEKVLYYPGEAFYGLSKLYWLDHNDRWKKVALRGIDYIANVRDAGVGTDKLEHDHWLMYAINEWYRVQAQKNQLAHANRLADAFLSRFNFEAKYPDFVGGFLGNKPQCTASATRLEGLSAVYRLAKLTNDQERMDRIFKALTLGASFLMRNQYDDINTMFFQNPEKVIGGYMASYWNPEIEIDFVQHATSALVNIRQIMIERAQAPAPSGATPAAPPEKKKKH